MNSHTQVFGLYVPGTTWPYRWPTWVKYLVLLVGSLTGFVVGNPWVSAAVLVATVCLILATRLPLVPSLWLPWPFWLMMAVLVGYHAWFTTWQTGVNYLVTLTTCIYLARFLTMTTPASALLDALAAAARPLRVVGLDPDRVALAAALMWKSIPFIIASVLGIRQAARARGLRGAQTVRCIVPVIVGIVGYALASGDALHARGLGDGTRRLDAQRRA